MKVIDLLNKIANDEELPLRIKVNGYEYRISNGQYYSDEKYMYLVDSANSIYHLNDEVEIIEEDKKIEKLESYISCGWHGTCEDLNREDLFNDLSKIGNKINEIIDKLNERDDKR